MVVAERKPLNEILAMLQPYKKILVAGCKGCVTVCTTGGKKEVEILASEIRISRKKEGQKIDVQEITLERQCDPEYIDQLESLVKDREAVISIACTVGPQYIAARYMDKIVFPGLNTTFIGGSREHGVFAEFCQACGSCGIHKFGGLCPIARCSKSLLNGPCGGSANGKCEISKEVDCIWQLIYDRLKGLGQLDQMTEVIPCKDWSTSRDGGPRKNDQGGFKIMKSGSKLEKVLTSGQFAVTGECGPPRGADAGEVRKKAAHLKGVVDSVNVTDNQTAVVRMSSVAGCLILIQEGLEPNLQMVVRDRNRIAMQSDILGAYALGIRNMLCLSGDHQRFGDHPAAKNVFDLDSMQLIQTVRKMRDEGKFLNDQEIHHPPKMFIGAAVNPFADPAEFRAIRMGKKIAAGVDFVQTQCIYNLDRFEKFMQQARDLGLTEKVYLLGGVTPMKSVGMANYMKNLVPGMDVPVEVINRMKGVAKKDQASEGIKIAIETIQRLKEMKGIAGVHVMAIEWEERVPEIVEMAGLLPRPQVE